MRKKDFILLKLKEFHIELKSVDSKKDFEGLRDHQAVPSAGRWAWEEGWVEGASPSCR